MTFPNGMVGRCLYSLHFLKGQDLFDTQESMCYVMVNMLSLSR